MLECGGGITETKEHDYGLKESFVGDESSFPLVAILDTNIVIPPSDIKLDEMASVLQLIHQVRDEREGVGITGGVFVQVSVILTGAKLAILLLDEEEGGGLWRVGRSNLPSG